jgi:hypothetical protein
MRASEASDALTRALVDAAARGQRPRCGDYETAHLWLSEHDGERKQAAIMCTGCVVWAECDQVGQHQRFGTWAGVDRTRAPGKSAYHRISHLWWYAVHRVPVRTTHARQDLWVLPHVDLTVWQRVSGTYRRMA